ncbi:hypothetical protein A0H76_3071, partial [Hepatospora eriocheir]
MINLILFIFGLSKHFNTLLSAKHVYMTDHDSFPEDSNTCSDNTQSISISLAQSHVRELNARVLIEKTTLSYRYELLNKIKTLPDVYVEEVLNTVIHLNSFLRTMNDNLIKENSIFELERENTSEYKNCDIPSFLSEYFQ